MNRFKTFGRYWGLPLLLSASLLLVWVLGEPAAELLMYQRFDIQSGQIWRLATAHWVHLSFQHLLLNLMSLALAWWLFHQALAGFTGYLLTGLISLGVTLSLFVLHPDIGWYAGFSGVLHGFLVAGALLSRRQNPMLSLATLLIVAIKLVIELVRGAEPGLAEFINSPILIHAHVYGALFGGLYAICMRGASPR
ncbi:rhombosortase [Marinobacter salinus]|uniref:rhombosortase n=1 Tax=Marinobacter salinus TaxID=1874317 RepID=UPI0012FD8CD6|nr:rhombosortase [Marinobacter salinus]